MFDRIKRAFKAVAEKVIEKVATEELSEEKLEPILWDFKVALLESDVALDVADAICEGVHFLLGPAGAEASRDAQQQPSFPPPVTPYRAGWKLLAENLSDVAAMGGEPLFSVATCHAPGGTTSETLRGLVEGLLACAERYGVAHVGGDLLAETVAVLTGDKMETIGPLSLRGHFAVATVPCEEQYTKREQIEALQAEGSSAERRYAQAALRFLETEGRVPSEVPVRVQTLWLTKDLALVGRQRRQRAAVVVHARVRAEVLPPVEVQRLGVLAGVGAENHAVGDDEPLAGKAQPNPPAPRVGQDEPPGGLAVAGRDARDDLVRPDEHLSAGCGRGPPGGRDDQQQHYIGLDGPRGRRQRRDRPEL